MKLENETVWLSANQMSTLFDRDEKTIRKHINNVFKEQELMKENNTHFLRVDGVKQPVAFYSLDVIISVGYRVKSRRGTQFRQWANTVLRQYIINGYALRQQVQIDRYNDLKDVVRLMSFGCLVVWSFMWRRPLCCHGEAVERKAADVA